MEIIILIMTSMFLFMSHPLTSGFILLIQTILISIFTGMLTYNFWFSYILFLIMIGGMLILFIYMTSIASNEKFNFSYKLLILFFSMLMFYLIYLYIDSYFFNMLLNTYDLIKFNNYSNYKFSMMKLSNWPNNLIIILMIIYLLITLIAVVKITKIQHGPLRQMN
uniref:NADH-ubiquinone oxidoreductase chain 6 n=1 Tax=Leptura arcuata TaxID=184452 RepID=A0A343ET51_LEPAC|nr:NADH dehydrogenase subunit 6 [Leptura arcuata]QVM79137.1 NADH dehydrogenase subunit 6 [Leptura annularis]